MLNMMPGMNNKAMQDVDMEQSEREMAHMEAIISP